MTGDLAITGGASSVIKAVGMTSVNGSITTNDVDQFHLTALTSVTYLPSILLGVFSIIIDKGNLILGWASRLDAFSAYP